jgi:hypothetical protein
LGAKYTVWISGDLDQKRLVQKLVFRSPLVIDPSQAIGTADLSLPFKMLKDISSGKNELGRRGFILGFSCISSDLI